MQSSCPNKKPRTVELRPPPLDQSFYDLYGFDDTLNVERIARDIDAAAASSDNTKLAFARRFDSDGKMLLHFLAWFPLNERVVPLVRGLLKMDPKLAQVVDGNQELPLWNYFHSLSHSGDDLRYVWHNLSDNRAPCSLELLLQAFPEAIFDKKVLSCLCLDREYKSDDLCRIWNNNTDVPADNHAENEQEQEESSDDDDSSDDEDDECERAFVGLLKLAFTDGFDRTPSPESVLKTGKRAPIHILCSHAYLCVFESLFDLVFQPNMASLPDPAAQNMLPLQLLLKSPVLGHSLVGGKIYGFCQMRKRKQNIPLSVVQKLVDAYPRALTTPDENGCLPLHLAVRHNNLQLVQTILQRNPSSLAVHEHQGQSPVLLACQHHCDLDLVYFLVRANPNINEWYNATAFLTNQRMLPPKIVPIANQTSKAPYTTLWAKATEDSSPIDWWGLEVLRAWKLKAGRERTPWILPDGSNPCDVRIDPQTGRISYSARYTKDAIVQVMVTAENAAGWSSMEFEIEFPGDPNQD